jgi:DNA polymerase-3 subunit delta
MAAPLSFDSVYRLLKRAPLDPVYYLTGDEDLLKDEVVQWIVEKAVDQASRDFNLDFRNAGDLTGEEFHSLVETPPMLADRRAVVVKGVEQWRSNSKIWKVVHKYLERPSPTTVLVLTHGPDQKTNTKVAQSAVHVRVQPLSPDRLRRWVAMRADRAGVALTEDAVEHLLKAVGADLSNLAMELDKLAAAAPVEGESLDTDAVASLVGVRRGETLDDWVEAVLLREIPKALDMLEVVLSRAGISGVRLASALGTGLVGLRLARALADEGHPGSAIRKKVLAAIRANRPFGVGDWAAGAALWTRAAESWSRQEADMALAAAYECDRKLKSTTLGDERAIITGMLIQLIPVEAAA